MNLSWSQLLSLLSFPVAIAAGQILFKRAASQIDQTGGLSWIFQVAMMPTMWAAVALYGAATVLWVRILTTIPLSRAYPFVALAFVLVPAVGYFFFNESINTRYAIGTALIVIGVAVAARA